MGKPELEVNQLSHLKSVLSTFVGFHHMNHIFFLFCTIFSLMFSSEENKNILVSIISICLRSAIDKVYSCSHLLTIMK